MYWEQSQQNNHSSTHATGINECLGLFFNTISQALDVRDQNGDRDGHGNEKQQREQCSKHDKDFKKGVHRDTGRRQFRWRMDAERASFFFHVRVGC